MGYETYNKRHIPERMRRSYDEDGSGTSVWTDRPEKESAIVLCMRVNL